MKKLFIIFIFTISSIITAQENPSGLTNINFEKMSDKTGLPEGWFLWGMNYVYTRDSLQKTDNKYSMRIEPAADRKSKDFGCLATSIPVNFQGKTISVKAKMKLENVSGGSVGLLLRVDDKNNKSISFDNMLQNNIAGTVDWKEYSVELPIVEGARTIYLGPIISGTGKLWVSDIKIDVDGKDIKLAEPKEIISYKADSDKEFDNGSGIVINDLNELQTENLFVLGKLWGFLKYYHPKIGEGEYNWDYELFRIMPKILNVSKTERDEIFLAWINKLGEITEFNEKKISDYENATILPELDWLSNKNIFSDEIIAKLDLIKNAKRKEESYYIGMYEVVNNPKFNNENSYTNIDLDDGLKLLSLYRYWNMIQYFFPDKNLIGEDWNIVLKEFIPKFVKGRMNSEYTLNVLALIARIHDTHGNIWGENRELNLYYGVNRPRAITTFIEEKLIVTDFYSLNDSTKKDLSDIKIGDRIVSINGKAVSDIVKDMLPLTPASNYPTQLRDIARNILRTNEYALKIEIERDGKTESRELSCYDSDIIDFKKYYSNDDKKSWSIINKNIGYIYPGKIKNTELDSMMKALSNTKGIVIDLRCYPSEFIVFTLSKYLMPLPKEFVKFRTGSTEYPGLFTVNDYYKIGDTNKSYYKGKIVILVNETTQSSAEYHTMAFRTAPNATVIGSTTAGADGNVSSIYLPGGIFTYISGIGVLTPEGNETQRVGIIPDKEVKPTVKGFREGKDEVLNAAIEMIGK